MIQPKPSLTPWAIMNARSMGQRFLLSGRIRFSAIPL
jgi:hypothetical protein